MTADRDWALESGSKVNEVENDVLSKSSGSPEPGKGCDTE